MNRVGELDAFFKSETTPLREKARKLDEQEKALLNQNAAKEEALRAAEQALSVAFSRKKQNLQIIADHPAVIAGLNRDRETLQAAKDRVKTCRVERQRLDQEVAEKEVTVHAAGECIQRYRSNHNDAEEAMKRVESLIPKEK